MLWRLPPIEIGPLVPRITSAICSVDVGWTMPATLTGFSRVTS
jgi:hypothetical protein